MLARHNLLSADSRGGAKETVAREDPIFVRNYTINAQVKPPKELDADVEMDLEVLHDGSRFVVFELSRFLKIQSVEADGRAVEFIQNPAVEGTRLARSGNDMVALLLPQPVRQGQKIRLRFVYGGEVLAEAGKGLLYVGARGNWYPNRGLVMSDFDLTFHYPPGWTLVATGKPEAVMKIRHHVAERYARCRRVQVERWVSERPSQSPDSISASMFGLPLKLAISMWTLTPLSVWNGTFPRPRHKSNPSPGDRRVKSLCHR